jgi:hypothetical protein
MPCLGCWKWEDSPANLEPGRVGERLKPVVLKREIAESLSDTKFNLILSSRQTAWFSIFWNSLILA